MKALFLMAVVVASGCAGANGANCDPATIAVGGNCYWDKTQACDALSCPLDQCIVHEGHPASVECKKPTQ
jgi:hypothetical protein